jgi:hypothetical protein
MAAAGAPPATVVAGSVDVEVAVSARVVVGRRLARAALDDTEGFVVVVCALRS